MHAHAKDTRARHYERRTPERSVTYQVLQEHWETFRDRTEHPIPKFVKAEVEAYLRCGILAHGFVRTACEDCGHEELVAFSCKRRGFCGSCIGRRMSETSMHLVDEVLPEVPVRQWVSSFSWQLRYLMGYDRALASEILNAVAQTVRDRIAWRIKHERKLASVEEVETGCVMFVQRFDSALRLNVHAHTLVLDGGYVWVDEKLVFHKLGDDDDSVTQADVEWVAKRAWQRIEVILRKHGRDIDDVDPVAEQEPFLAEVYGHAISGRGTTKVLDEADETSPSGKALLAQVGGINVHAERVIDGRDRPQLERLCRYAMRPPIAQKRLELLPDGRVYYEMKRAWKDGTVSLVFEPLEFIRRLCAFVPPPYSHMVRYFGILAPHALFRDLVVPKRPLVSGQQLSLFSSRDLPSTEATETSRIAWALLLKRVFKIDVTVCRQCSGDVRVLEAVTEKEEIRCQLMMMGLPVDPPELHPPRAPPQRRFEFDDAC